MVGGSVVRQRRGSAQSSNHEIRFARSAVWHADRVCLHGGGPPLVIVSCWLSHLQYDWQSPVWRHFLDRPRRHRDGRPLRRAGLRPVRLGRRRLLARGPARRPRGGRRRRRPRAVRAPRDVRAARGRDGLRRAGTPSGSPGWSSTGRSAASRSTFDGRRARRGGDLPQHDPGRLGARGSRSSGASSRDGSSRTRPRSRCAGSTSCSGCRRRRERRRQPHRRASEVDIADELPRITAPTLVLQARRRPSRRPSTTPPCRRR